MPRDVERFWRTTQNLRRFEYGPRAVTGAALAYGGGYLTGNQTITISGDVDGSGTTAIALTLDTVNANVGTFASHTVNGKGLTTAAGNLTGDVTTVGAAATIANSAVTLAKMQSRAAATLLGNPTAGVAAPSEITLGTNLSFAGGVLNATAAAGGLSGMVAGQIPIAATATTVTSSANLSGDVVTNATLAATIQANAVTTAKILNANVTYAKIQNVANNRVLGNTSGSAAAPSEIVLPLSVANGGTGASTATAAPWVEVAGDTMTGTLNGTNVALSGFADFGNGADHIRLTNGSNNNVLLYDGVASTAKNIVALNGGGFIATVDGNPQHGALFRSDFDNTMTLQGLDASGTAGLDTNLAIYRPSATNNAYVAVTMTAVIGNEARLYMGTDFANNVYKIGQVATGTQPYRNLVIQGGATDALTIATNANVGIGTTGPAEKLSVVGNITTTGNITASGALLVNSSITTSNATTGGYSFTERDALGNSWLWYANAGKARLYFSGDKLTVDRATGDLVAAGNLTIGTSSAATLVSAGNYTVLYSPDATRTVMIGDATALISLYRNNSHVFQDAAGATSFASVASGGTTFGSPTGGAKGAGTVNAVGVYAGGTLLTSDATLKTDIEALPAACLPLVAAVEPKSFRWQEPDDGKAAERPDDFSERRHTGFLAQDLAEAEVPGIVEGKPGEGMAIDVGAMLAVLWQAVRELSAQVKALEAGR